MRTGGLKYSNPLKDNTMNNYPKLMRHNTDGVIVKFTSDSIGTVVGKGHTG